MKATVVAGTKGHFVVAVRQKTRMVLFHKIREKMEIA